MGGGGWAAAAGMAAAGQGAGPGVPILARRIVPGDEPWWPPGLVTAAAFGGLWLRFGASPLLPAFCYLVAVGVPLAFIDARHRRLPDLMTLPSYPAGLLLLRAPPPFIPPPPPPLVYALTPLAPLRLFFLLPAFVYPAGIGWGDV